MGLNYFYSPPSKNNSCFNIPTRTIHYGNISNNFDKTDEINFLRNKPRKFSCDSNISNISGIFQKTLHSHMINKETYNRKNTSTISTNSSKSGSSNTEEQKDQNEISISPIKNMNDIRKSYYHQLIRKKIEFETKSTIKNNTIFIFDWHDTLFFTTHINPSENNTFFYESQTEKKFMNRIEYYVSEILNKALSKGEVVIITNSGDGWVNACAKFYYPNLIPILKQIKIISARDLYQKEYPNDPTTWKIKAFNDLKKKFNFEKCIVSNIICIGDNNCEIIAAQKLGEGFDNCLVKTIKFREKPNLKELIKQIILINEQILRVYNYPKSLTIHVNKMKNPKKRK